MCFLEAKRGFKIRRNHCVNSFFVDFARNYFDIEINLIGFKLRLLIITIQVACEKNEPNQ